jgi:hypothetical protein
VSQDRSTTPSSEQACVNTDREIWRERDGDYYADSIHVTEGGGIGINCGGYVIVKPIREWFRLAAAKETLPTPLSETGRSLKDATLAELEQANSPEPFKAEDEYAPAYVTGPNGFRFQCYNAVEMARKLNVLFASSATSAISEDARDAARYRWMRVHGAALAGTETFRESLVRRCINLDEEVDALMARTDSEAKDV